MKDLTKKEYEEKFNCESRTYNPLLFICKCCYQVVNKKDLDNQSETYLRWQSRYIKYNVVKCCPTCKSNKTKRRLNSILRSWAVTEYTSETVNRYPQIIKLKALHFITKKITKNDYIDQQLIRYAQSLE